MQGINEASQMCYLKILFQYQTLASFLIFIFVLDHSTDHTCASNLLYTAINVNCAVWQSVYTGWSVLTLVLWPVVTPTDRVQCVHYATVVTIGVTTNIYCRLCLHLLHVVTTGVTTGRHTYRACNPLLTRQLLQGTPICDRISNVQLATFSMSLYINNGPLSTTIFSF